ncbi:hypothetical protein LCGC14_0732370 [marine sediment metagenome]|uniref:Uncharacterized protein n=1 Tax=marine sediment metagenome TaxID=412755 RepID=A0A0F9QU62_9ZZZZ|nr:MAG: hypothetical protein Lokiarch_23290 [Candidatus Lokiarchaeum sp. GC14_75]HEC38941.1 hypothetical protein [bacterium]
MSKKIKEKIKEKIKSSKGFDEIRDALLRAIKDILDSIVRSFVVNIEITCKIAGVGTIATFEYQKDDIPSVESGEEESSKLENFLKKLLEKAKDRIIDVIKSKNLGALEFTAGTESIPGISWLTEVNFKVTIDLK